MLLERIGSASRDRSNRRCFYKVQDMCKSCKEDTSIYLAIYSAEHGKTRINRARAEAPDPSIHYIFIHTGKVLFIEQPHYYEPSCMCNGCVCVCSHFFLRTVVATETTLLRTTISTDRNWSVVSKSKAFSGRLITDRNP